MARKAAGLTAAKVRTAGQGRYGDSNGLFLLVRSGGARYWVFRYRADGRMREMGLGAAGEGKGQVSLAEVRSKAAPLWTAVKAGNDPLIQREEAATASKAAAQEAKVRGITFRAVAAAYIAAHEAGWRNPKHRGQWRATLESYTFPHMGDLPAADVGTAHVLAALEPLWREKPETATRVRGRIEAVLDYAKVRGWRAGDNPARWRGHLDHLLPARSKVAKVKHHPALPWREIGAFMAELRGRDGIAARALEFAILTAARTEEALGATWGEVDLFAALRTISGERMKGGREHRVPLSAPVLALLGEMAKLRTTDDPKAPIFPGQEAGRPLSQMAMLMLVRRMNDGGKEGERPRWCDSEGRAVVPHGFRSTFRDWVGEATGYPTDVAEAALAHTVGDKTVAAYARGDLFDKRRALMGAWVEFCAQPAMASAFLVLTNSNLLTRDHDNAGRAQCVTRHVQDDRRSVAGRESCVRVSPQNPQNTLPGARSMVSLIEWPRLLQPRSPEDWHTAMATAIRHAQYLPADEIEFLAQIAERGPSAKKGRRPYDKHKVSVIEVLIRHSSTKAEAVRRIARWFQIDERNAKQVVRRYSSDRLEEKSAQDGELVRAGMAESKRVEAAREIEAARRDAEFHKIMARYNVDPE